VSQKKYLNYPYTRATDQLGASMATPGYLIKDSPKKISQNAKMGSISGFYPKEILAQVFSRDLAQGD
jgi:hypothetical protein